MLCLCSCDRYYYQPNGVHAPLLVAANDAHLTATEDGSNRNIQAAYSPIKHLGIIAGYSSFSYKADKVDVNAGDVDAHAHLAEMGAGYYYAVGKKAKVLWDIYGGVGGGKLTSDVNMHFFRPFIQPGAGLRTPYFDIAFNYRFSGIRYSQLDVNGHDATYLEQHNLVNGDRSINGTTYFFGEPSITLRGGYKFLKLQVQLVSSHAISNVPWSYNNSELTLGIHFALEDLLAMINPKPETKK